MIYKPFQSPLLDIRLRLFILACTNIYFVFFLDISAYVNPFLEIRRLRHHDTHNQFALS